MEQSIWWSWKNSTKVGWWARRQSNVGKASKWKAQTIKTVSKNGLQGEHEKKERKTKDAVDPAKQDGVVYRIPCECGNVYITVTIRRKDSTMQMLSFVHVFKKCSQVSDTVLAIIDDVFQQLKSTSPEVQTVFLRQDNAGCYHSTSVLLSVQRIATKNNINLCQVDYSDPQGGKGPCDRKAAKSH